MVGSMTASVRRRTSFSRALLALGGVALLALLAVAALLLGGALSDNGRTSAPEAPHAIAASAVGEPDHASPTIHGIHQQPSTRARSGVTFAVLAVAIVVAAWAFRRLRPQRAGRLRTLRIPGLPPGRGPPALRIA
jgi:hypothetical protein